MMKTWRGRQRRHRHHSILVQVIFLTLTVSHAIKEVAPLDCRIFPFHPVCRGHNAGKRSGAASAFLPVPAPGVGDAASTTAVTGASRKPPASSDPSSSLFSFLHEPHSNAKRRHAPSSPPGLFQPTYPNGPPNPRLNNVAVLFRKYAFAPKCRGTTSKRAIMMARPTTQSIFWPENNENNENNNGNSDNDGNSIVKNTEGSRGKAEAAPHSANYNNRNAEEVKNIAQDFNLFLAPSSSSSSSHDPRRKRSQNGLSLPSTFSSFMQKKSDNDGLPSTFSSFYGKRSGGNSIPQTFSSFYVKRSPSAEVGSVTASIPQPFSAFYAKRGGDNAIPQTFSSFYVKKRQQQQIPNTFSAFYGKRAAEDVDDVVLPSSFSSFYAKRSGSGSGFGREDNNNNVVDDEMLVMPADSYYNYPDKRSSDNLPASFSSFYIKRSGGDNSMNDNWHYDDLVEGKRDEIPAASFSSFYNKRHGGDLNDLSSFSSFYKGKRSAFMGAGSKSKRGGADMLKGFSSFYFPEKKLGVMMARPQSRSDHSQKVHFFPFER